MKTIFGILLCMTLSAHAFADCEIYNPGDIQNDPAYDYKLGKISGSGQIFHHDNTFNRDVTTGRIDADGKVYNLDHTFNQYVPIGRVASDGQIFSYDPTFKQFVLIARVGTDGVLYNHDHTFNQDVAVGRVLSNQVQINGMTFHRLRGTCERRKLAAHYFLFEKSEQ